MIDFAQELFGAKDPKLRVHQGDALDLVIDGRLADLADGKKFNIFLVDVDFMRFSEAYQKIRVKGAGRECWEWFFVGPHFWSVFGWRWQFLFVLIDETRCLTCLHIAYCSHPVTPVTLQESRKTLPWEIEHGLWQIGSWQRLKRFKSISKGQCGGSHVHLCTMSPNTSSVFQVQSWKILQNPSKSTLEVPEKFLSASFWRMTWAMLQPNGLVAVNVIGCEADGFLWPLL